MTRLSQIKNIVLFLVGTMVKCQQLTDDCGSPSVQPTDIYTRESRIVGGKVIKDGSWSWLLALVGYKPNQLLYQFCGAALLNEEWIVIAAHCVDNGTEVDLTETLRVIPGQRNLRAAVETEGPDNTLMKISRIILHEQHDKPTGSRNYDIALIQLAQPLELSDQIHPICLPTMHVNSTTKYPNVMKNARNGRPVLFVAGWGRTQEGGVPQNGSGSAIGQGSDVAKQVDIEMYNTRECKTTWGGSYFSDQMICGGFVQGGKDACQGDSGGPLIQKGANGKWQLQGIVSWGAGCAEADTPGVYTNVRGLVPWILDTITNEFRQRKHIDA